MKEDSMKLISRMYDYFLKFTTFLQDPVLFVMRVIWGGLFMLEGWDKFIGIAANAKYFAELGFSNPVFMVYLSASAELFGGLLLLLGLFTRIAAFPLIITMVIAAIMDPSKSFLWGHGSDQTEQFLSQIPFTFMYAALVAMLFGPGKWSLDYKFKDKCTICR